MVVVFISPSHLIKIWYRQEPSNQRILSKVKQFQIQEPLTNTKSFIEQSADEFSFSWSRYRCDQLSTNLGKEGDISTSLMRMSLNRPFFLKCLLKEWKWPKIPCFKKHIPCPHFKGSHPYPSDNVKHQIDVMSGWVCLKRSPLTFVATCILFSDVENNAWRYNRWMGGSKI